MEESSGVNNRVCDIGTEDSEWLEVREKFSAYMAISKFCHTSQRLGPCQREKEWKEWKCAEFKAIHYAFLKDHTECFRHVKDSNDFLSKYNFYCGKSYIFSNLVFLIFSNLIIFYI